MEEHDPDPMGLGRGREGGEGIGRRGEMSYSLLICPVCRCSEQPLYSPL